MRTTTVVMVVVGVCESCLSESPQSHIHFGMLQIVNNITFAVQYEVVASYSAVVNNEFI